jgi:hypothetical protein
MSTIINNPPGTGEDSGSGIVMGTIIALLLIILFIFFVWPSIRSTPPAAQPQESPATTNINVNVP